MTLAYTKTYPLDRRFAVEFALVGERLEARWTLHVPKGRKARNLLPEYRKARDEFLASLAVPAMVIEL